ncbi:MAG: 50S ribosomal protein L5 [Candidatus Levybacteria bacterium CG_4_9_14_3_um_filter_35_16]|nr:MAG: 50S ribosomal protein L5 [Candidatus Levybacteria bacterium CG22_combo_CG10-13_8_21_14_all_35_11]PJA91344.1 MAG: 50S ribosomal protein L5 [Candidatus Levybacteria bacterium CG_4_9_14_3_um_filter_35_16]PJC54783.1 MAG: 50S ribosomal protein L5 [Candidatus Levybacteria bacterium CG_4_9_14_0_2_um_filter_35_21]
MNLQEKFIKEIVGQLKKELGIKNNMALPKLLKIVVNMGVKDALLDKKSVEKAAGILAQISGQKPKVTKAKKSIATFKLRAGDEVGLAVTLRGKRMYDFFEKITTIVLPRLRDFHGVKTTSFDKHGNYTLGFVESAVFPEIDLAKVDKIQGLEISIVTTARDNKEGFALLKALGMPFKK